MLILLKIKSSFLRVLFIIGVILSAQQVLLSQPLSTEKFKFGVNVSFHEKKVANMILSSDSYAEFFKSYSINYLRFPGGLPARYFLYSNPNLSLSSKGLLKTFNESRGKKQLKLQPDKFLLPVDYYEKFLQFCVRKDRKSVV